MEQTINMKEKQFQKKVENRFEEELFGLNDQIAVLRVSWSYLLYKYTVMVLVQS